MRAEWITMTKVGDVRLVQPLAGRDGPSRGHFLAISPWTEPTSSETYSKNLKVLRRRFKLDGVHREGHISTSPKLLVSTNWSGR